MQQQQFKKERNGHNYVSNLKYILIKITSGAATVCRQHQDAMGLEVYKQLCNRFAIPVGTRSIGYLTRLLKPNFDNNNFEESFSTWEFELAGTL